MLPSEMIEIIKAKYEGKFSIYTVNHKKTWQFIFDYNFG